MGSFRVVPEVIDNLGVEGLGAGCPSGLGFEVCAFDVRAELGELDVDLIAPHRLDLVAYPLLGLVPMVRAQDSVPRGEFELVSPALCDADIDGRLTVGGRAEEEGGFQCGIVSLPMSLHWLSWGSIQFRAFSRFRPALPANTD